MEKMSKALEKAKMLVGLEVDEENPQEESSFFDDFNRQCTLSTQQVVFRRRACVLVQETQDPDARDLCQLV